MAAEKNQAPSLSVAELEAMLAAAKGKQATEDFAEPKAAAEKAGFKTMIAPAHNGGSPALRVDY
jgi:hypothetical protein